MFFGFRQTLTSARCRRVFEGMMDPVKLRRKLSRPFFFVPSLLVVNYHYFETCSWHKTIKQKLTITSHINL